MNILMAGETCPPHIGGVETVVENVSATLAALGHKVHIICCHKGVEENRQQYTSNGILYIRCPVGLYGIPRNNDKLKNYLTRILKDVDVLHLHNVHNPFIYFIWKVWQNLYKNQRPRLVITPHYHGTGHTLLAKVLWISWRRVVRAMLRSADCVHAVSEYEKSLLERDFEVNPVIIEHGVREDVLQCKWSPEDYFIYSGRIERYKRLDYVIRLVGKLRVHGLKLRLLIIGRGTYLSKILSLSKKLSIHLEYLDFLPRCEYLERLSKAVAFINLSEHEAYSLTTLEAVSIGVPAIVAEPWGRHFANKGQVLILNFKKDLRYNVKVTSAFLKEVLSSQKQYGVKRLWRPRLWRDVVYDYLVKLYN